MKIVEFRCNHPILREALGRVPEIELEWVQSDISESERRIQVLLWATGDDFEAFEATLEADPTITNPSRRVDIGGRRLYQLDIVDEGYEKSVYPIIVEEAGVIQALTATQAGWEFRVGFPDNEALSRFFSFCSRHDIPYSIHRIFQERVGDSDVDGMLTDAQRETLQKGLEIGYFDVPRRNDLRDLGNELEISDSAASQRLRRGLKTLIVQTVTPKDRQDSDTESG